MAVPPDNADFLLGLPLLIGDNFTAKGKDHHQ